MKTIILLFIPSFHKFSAISTITSHSMTFDMQAMRGQLQSFVTQKPAPRFVLFKGINAIFLYTTLPISPLFNLVSNLHPFQVIGVEIASGMHLQQKPFSQPLDSRCLKSMSVIEHPGVILIIHYV
jgi:hypothetical protein